MKKNLFVFLLGLAPWVGHAEVISESQAHQIALDFFNVSPSRSVALPLKMVWDGQEKAARATAASRPAFYVFNRGENQGFVIVSGNDSALPILAYSNVGTFGVENMPENIRQWARERSLEMQQIGEAEVKSEADVRKARIKALQKGEEVVLKTPSWSQDDPYNRRCPKFWDTPAPTGCTITATAIVMGYYQWPDRGVGTIPGYTYNDLYGQSVSVPEVTLGEEYLWGIMPSINGNALDFSNEAQANTIAGLMAHIGTLAKAHYNYTLTSAEPSDVAANLPKYMKYKKGLKCLNRDYFTFSRWTQMLKDEINASHPFVYTGYDAAKTAGHAFVLDGYNSEGLFHVNWGWGGLSDGFYALTALSPAYQGIGGSSSGDFSYSNYALMDMRPCYDGKEDPAYESCEFIKYYNKPLGLSVDDLPNPVTVGSSFIVTGGRFVNMGNVSLNTELGLVHTDKYGVVKEVLYNDKLGDAYAVAPGEFCSSIVNNGEPRISVTIQKEVIPGDRLRFVYKSTVDGSWKPVIADPELGKWEIVLSEATQEAEPIPVSTTASDNLTGHAVATFSAEWATTASDPKVEAYYAEQKDQSTIVLKQIERQAGNLVVPANTGVVLSTAAAASFTMEPTSAAPAHVPASNLLKSTTAYGTTVSNDENAYILSKKGGEVMFHVLSGSHRTIAANRSYLVLPASVNAATVKMNFEDAVTGMEELTIKEEQKAQIYDLSGRKVTRTVSGGVYIKNGRKFVVK